VFWGVKSYRGPRSTLGTGASWVHDGRQVITFPDGKSARIIAASLNRGALVPYVRYVAEPLETRRSPQKERARLDIVGRGVRRK
jgi:hypothetical protein